MSALQQGNFCSFEVVNLDRQPVVKIIRQRGVNLVQQEVVFYASFSSKFSQLKPLSNFHLFSGFNILANISKFLYLCKYKQLYYPNGAIFRRRRRPAPEVHLTGPSRY